MVRPERATQQTAFDPNADSAAMTAEKVKNLGTEVTVTYVDEKGQVHIVTPTVDDRGPFLRGSDGKAVEPLQPDPKIIIDLTPKMMMDLTGKSHNLVPVEVTIP